MTGKRGPISKSHRQKELEGYPDKRRPKADELQKQAKEAEAIPIKAPTMPASLLPEAKREWKRIVPQLLENRMLTERDRVALSLLCQAWARWLICQEYIDEIGPVFRNEQGGWSANPCVAQARQHETFYKEMCKEFGLTPNARLRQGVPLEPPQAVAPQQGGVDAGLLDE